MSVVAHALTTTAKVKLYLGISDTAQDTLIDNFVNQATDFIERFCGKRRFLRTTYTNEIYDSPRGRCLFLNNFPVSALTIVEYRGGTPSTPTWTTYDANGYILYGNEGFIKFYSMLPAVSQGLRVTYAAGYLIDWTAELSATHTLPFDLTEVATELAAGMYNLKASQGIKSMSTEGQSVSFAGSGLDILTDIQKAILGNYRTLRIAI